MTALSNTARRTNSFFICSPMLFSDYTIFPAANQGAFFKFSALPCLTYRKQTKKAEKPRKMLQNMPSNS